MVFDKVLEIYGVEGISGGSGDPGCVMGSFIQMNRVSVEAQILSCFVSLKQQLHVEVLGTTSTGLY